MEKQILTEKEVHRLHTGTAVVSVLRFTIPGLLGLGVAIISMFSGLFPLIVFGIILLAAMIPLVVRVARCLRFLVRCPKIPKMVCARRAEPPKMTPYPVYDKYSENKFLYFENYGWYPSPDMDSPDLDRAYQNARFQWWDSKLGDQFYLLLDGDNHVVHVYPCDRYEYTGPLTKHTFVNGRIQK